MDSKTRQKALDEITPEELAKVKAHQAKRQSSVIITEELLTLAEFALMYGWEAYVAARDDEIDYKELVGLLVAGRKIQGRQMYEASQTAFIGAVAAQSKKPLKSFTALTKNIVKETKVDKL